MGGCLCPLTSKIFFSIVNTCCLSTRKLLLNPTEQSTAVHDGLETIPFIVRRFRVMERLLRPGFETSTPVIQDDGRDPLVKHFEDTTVKLYSTILEFQIRAVRQFSKSWLEQYGRDVFRTNDWKALTTKIQELDAKCTRLAQALNFDKLDKVLVENNKTMERQFQEWRGNFEELQEELGRSSRALEQQLKNQTAWRQTDEERECCQLFRDSNPYEDQKNRTTSRVPETCRWFLENPIFLGWRDSDGPDLLWLSAKPGSGKSVLAKTLVEERLVTTLPRTETVVCYFFFKDVSAYQRSINSAIAAILHQIFSQYPSLIHHALLDFNLNGKELPRLFDVMWKILENIAFDPTAREIICVLDALDECDDSDRNFLIKKIKNFYSIRRNSRGPRPKLKFLLTSRPYSNIRGQFNTLIREVPTIHLSGDRESDSINQEIDLFIREEVNQIAAEKDFEPEIQTYLLDQLLQIENRTYLWLSLILEEIRLSERAGTREALYKVIKELPRSVIEAYDSILSRCREPELAKTLLHFIVAAKEPLHVKDINVALAVATHEDCRSYEDLSIESDSAFETRLKSICGLFVSVDGGYVFLIHQTAKEYLVFPDDGKEVQLGLWRHSLNYRESHSVMARACTSLLLFDLFDDHSLILNDEEDTPQATIKPPKPIPISYPFLDYAAQNWQYHCTEAKLKDSPEMQEPILKLVDSISGRFKTWFTIYRINGKNLGFPQGMTSLGLCAEFDFVNVTQVLLKTGHDPNVRDEDGATPLQRAAKSSKEIMELLLDAGADPNARGWDSSWYEEIGDNGSEHKVKPLSGTALYVAAMRGDVESVHLLIDHGAMVDLPVTDDPSETDLAGLTTPIMMATYLGKVEAVEALIQRGSNVMQRLEGVTPLHIAAIAGYEEVAGILLDNGANINDGIVVNVQLNEPKAAVSPKASNIEHVAGGPGHKRQSVKMEDTCADNTSEVGNPDHERADSVPLPDSSTGSDHNSTYSGHLTVTVNDDGEEDGTEESSRASFSGKNVEAIIFRELGYEGYDNYAGYTPLFCAVGKGEIKMAEFLLKKGADVNHRCEDGLTVLGVLCRGTDSNSIKQLEKLLLRFGAVV